MREIPMAIYTIKLNNRAKSNYVNLSAPGNLS